MGRPQEAVNHRMSNVSAPAATPAETRNWRESLLVYRKPRVIGMLFLGFSAGLPFLLVFSTLSAWLRTYEVSRTAIGMFAWVGLLYSIKFCWAPLVDRLPLPLLTRVLGRRRSWMLFAQFGIVAGLLGMAGLDPTVALLPVALFSVFVAFCSATQDIAIDAYRIEAVAAEDQGAMAATYQLGYRIALLVSGAGALYLSDFFSWSAAYYVMAACMLVGPVTALIIDEPEGNVQAGAAAGRVGFGLTRVAAWFGDAVIGPFAEFFRRNGSFALLLLTFIGLSRVSDLLFGNIANVFYLDLGYTRSEIATVAKLFGFGITIGSAFVGGIAVSRYGPVRPLLLATALVAVTNLCFAALAAHGVADIRYLAGVISADNFAVGFAGTVFIAYFSSLTHAAYTATQYALFTSLMLLPGKLLSGFSGMMVDATDYVTFFLYASAAGIPAIVLAVIITRRAGFGGGNVP